MANEIQFPTSPTNGNIYSMGGRNYRYDSAQDKFVAVATATIVEGGGVTIYATIDDLPLSGNTQGDLAHVTANNTLYFWNGSGWYKIALINNSPSISNVNSSYTLSDIGADTVITMVAEDPEGLAITYSIASDTSGNTATVVQGTGANTNIFTITPSTDENDNGTFSLTFRASDGVNIATAPASFTLNISTIIENSNYTTALITSIGTNNQVNNTFVDSSTNSHTITAAGNATQTTFSPYRHGGYSVYFDGTTDNLGFASLTSMNPNTYMCLECWVKLDDKNNSEELFIGRDSGYWLGYDFPAIGVAQDKFGFGMYAGGSWQGVSSTTSPESGVWYHIAAVKENSTLKIYVNGVLENTATITGTPANGGVVGIGANTNQLGGSVKGYLADVRAIISANQSSLPYTSAFTPPTERLTAITDTQLLACHLPYFADGSTNNHTITRNGNTSIQPVSPYVHGGYDSAEHSGSIYLDGNGAYLTTPSSAAFSVGTGDFTLELWTYYTASPGSYTFLFGLYDGSDELAIRTGDGGFGYRVQAVLGSGAAAVYDNTSYTTSYLLNKWTHLAFCRSGTTVTFYIDGIAVATKTSAIDVGLDSDGARIGAGAPYTPNAHVSGIRFLNGTALYTSDFTPPTAPLTAITNTSLLLSGTNAGIIDKSQSVKSLTLNGDVKSSTTQSKYLTSSMYFDGTGDSLTFGTASDYVWLHNKTTDYTIEFWMYAPSDVTTRQCILETAATTTSSGIMVDITSGTARLNIYRSVSSSLTTSQSSSASISTGQWHHVAFSVTTSDVKTFVDGTLEATTSWSLAGSSANSQGSLSIGGSELGSVTDFTGYLSDVRITKGLARYTANFTPPTAALQG